MAKKYEAWVNVCIRVVFVDDGDLDLRDQAFEALPSALHDNFWDGEVKEIKEIEDE